MSVWSDATAPFITVEAFRASVCFRLIPAHHFAFGNAFLRLPPEGGPDRVLAPQRRHDSIGQVLRG